MKNITLEMSLKPFKQTDDEYIENVCTKVFEQWKPLIKDAECVSVMMWSADGSELLDYRGNPEDSFEWAYLIGGANNLEDNHSDIDPEGTGLHSTCYNYMDNPPKMTYKILKQIVSTLKNTGKRLFPDKKIEVGTTFDPGPEFARSDFKYSRHTEICSGNDMGKASMVCAYAVLKSDRTPYAAFPDGIEEGMPFGTFLGGQSREFMRDLGFDYLWLSNGFGFGRETWSTVGAIFDGEKFHCEVMEDINKSVVDFWTLFRKECPDYPIRTRGTNMSMGIDFSTDGVPLKSIYDGGYKLLPPPNSPWAALNGDYGLELMGHMSRIAYLPDENYLFRYYIHDPWWVNSPWYDRYGRQPHDIYMPLAVSRIDENGRIAAPNHLNILSIDNSFGDLPDNCANESIPHLLNAIKELPDEPGAVVWVYPFDEYSECSDSAQAEAMFFEDWYIRGAINNGLPLSTVTNTRAFTLHDKALYCNSVIVTPVPKAGTEFETQILKYARDGGRVIFYGSTLKAGKEFTDYIEAENTDGISGEVKINICGNDAGILKHSPLVCGGEITTVDRGGNSFVNTGKYTLGIHKGNTVWLRGTVSCDYVKGSQLLSEHDEKIYFIGESLMKKALCMLGTEIIFDKQAGVSAPKIMIHRYNNAYILSCFSPSTTVKTKMKLPLGAPVFDGYETMLENGYATYHFPKSEHRECRVFVEQKSGIVGCKEIPPVSAQYRRRVEVSGLENATVRFLGESYCKDNMHAVLNSQIDWYNVGDGFEGEIKTENGHTYYEVRNVTGKMVFSMPYKDKIFKQNK